MLQQIACVVLVAGVFAQYPSFEWFRNKKDCRDAHIEDGWIRGCANPGLDYIAYLGVPYAAPPTGRQRFKAPIHAYSWKGIYEADRVTKCAQKGEGVEDCLVVNIFTPVKTPTVSLPVLVYIHGGSFIVGSGEVQGVEFLVRQNMIVITMNYRLGVLGFLCLGTEDAPGNAGLKDQVAALQWIQRNVANFGGDPKQVTIYGMSAGGASVELLVLSKQTKGLFRHAIVESASATSVWVTDQDPLKTAWTIAEKLGFPTHQINTGLLGTYYQRVPARKLSQINYRYYNSLTDGSFGFVPCIENSTAVNTTEAFLTESPYEILTKEKYEKVPIMFLFSSFEGLYLRSQEYYQQHYKERMSANFLDFLPADLQFDSKEISIEMAENIQYFYFGNKSIGEDITEYLNYFGDYLVLHGLLNSAEIHSRKNNPVYLMEFAYKGNMGSYDKFYENINVAGHGDVIKHAILDNQMKSKTDRIAVARVVKLIANFVKFGNPTPERTNLLPILWPRVHPGNVSALYMDEELQVVNEPHWDSKEFWDHIYGTYRKKPKTVDPGR